MKLKSLLLTSALSFALTFAFCATALAQNTAEGQDEDLDATYATELVKKGTDAPNFTLPDADGKPHSLSDFKDKVVVIDFWASWCPDCRRDIPDILDLYDRYGSKATFISVSFDKNKEVWQKCVGKYEMEWLQVSELKPWKETQVSKDYGVKWIPSIVVVGADGKVLLSTVMLPKVKSLLTEMFGE